MQHYETVNILMVDDDTVDIKLFQRALKARRISNPLFFAGDGQEALELLNSGQISKPLIIILDINMPRMNGIEFLSKLRQHKTFKDSIVFVMTTSDAESDRDDAYSHHIAGYIVKSDLGENFLKAVDMLDIYQNTIQLPV